MLANRTSPLDPYALPTLPAYTLQPLPSLIPGISDLHLSLALPVLAYWTVSLFFHILDVYDVFPQYRLHTPAEVLKRNHVGRWDVFRDVIIQQIVQTFTGMLMGLVDEAPTMGKEGYDVAVWARRVRLLQRGIPGVLGMVGIDAVGLAKRLGGEHAMLAGALSGGVYPDVVKVASFMGHPMVAPAFAEWEMVVAKAIYYFLIPAVQFVLAICIIDTWQYFLHRAMHMNKWLYTTLHSRHHRLYVPYAYGALYNHPVEGFLLDTLGAAIAYLITGMTVRQSMWLFTCSTIKTVDDHCGYAFPWDPLQHLTSNNAGYHDVHHQSWGIKANFSQPFFTFWDGLLGTKWTGGDVSARYARAKIAAQKKLDADATEAITKSSAEDSINATDDSPYDAGMTSSAAQNTSPMHIPPGKAAAQAASSRQQVLDDPQGGGISVLREEAAEEAREQKSAAAQRRSPRKRAASSGLKGFAGRVGDSLQGRGTGVLGVERGRT